MKLFDVRIVKRIILSAVCLALALGCAVVPAGAVSDDGDIVEDLANHLGNYSTVLYDNKNGLPTSEANAIAQTEDGFIWIGSYSGLIRYDGYNFVRINSASGIASVVSLFVDSSQRLWIGTNDSGVAIMSKNFLRIYGKKDGLSALSVRCFEEADNGDIYIATTQGLCVSDKDLNITALDIPEIKDAYIHRLDKGPDGAIYGVTKHGDVFIVRDRKLQAFYESSELGLEGEAHAILMDTDNYGYAYLGTQEHFVYYGKIDNGFEIKETIDARPLEYINALAEINGQIWVCADNGVGSVKGNRVYSYDELDFTNSMEDMMLDYQGNIWFISSKQGVMKIVPNQFSDINKQYRLEPTIATSTCFFDGKLFVGNKNGGIIALGKDDVAKRIPVKKCMTASGEVVRGDNLLEILRNVTVRSIIRDSVGNIWISTYSKYGLVKYDGQDVICYTEDDGLPSNRVRAIWESDSGDIIVGCIGGVAIIRDGVVDRVYDEDDGILNSEILTVTQAANGDILVGSDGGGVYIISGDKVKHIGTEEGLASDIIMRIKKDPKLNLYWIVTSNSIAYLDENYKPTVLRYFPYSNNFDIFFNSFDQAWILSSNGIYVVPRSQLVNNVMDYDYAFYDSNNGLPCIATANSYSELTEDGELYIAGTTGVAKVNINEPFEDVSNLKVDVPYIEADGEMIYRDDQGVFNLPADVKKVDITGYVFTYSFMNPEITYYLEGFDRDKYTVKRSDFGTVSYTNLPGGRYTFVMDLRDSKGVEFKQYTIDINKPKAFYEYTAFRVLVGLIAMTIIALIVWRLMHITVISRQYEQIRVAKEEAERANTAKSKFLANMSHEIRTPINTIMGMNEMILRENADDVPAEYRDSVTGYANNIKVASETLLGLINNLLDLSKIESGKMELVEHDYDMQELLQSIVMMIRVRSNQKDLTFQTEIDQKLPIKLYGDYGKLKEVLLNLLTNAVKYTKEGGFTLSVQTKEISPDNCRISFAVTDTGIGIKPEDMDKLFTAFKRFEQVKNSGIQGTGLGLDISRQYVELMGGALKCESVYGQGSTFSFEIEQRIIDATPIGEFKVSDSKTVAEDYAPDFIAPEGRILVVDDNEMNLQVIKGLLKHSKLQLTLVTGGRECLEKLEEGSYHVVLLDHMMPGMDGIETLGHIREKYPDQVVIALTANVMNGGATFYKDAGFQDYLSKPVDAAQLENTLREYLPKELLIESQPGQDREDEQKMELPEDMKWLEDVDGLNVEEGIRYCGMPGQLLKFLHTFYDTLDAKAGEIEEAFRNKDIKFYTIKVHALKSTARIMGADKLSKLAEDLEKAGNENNLARIEADTGKLLEMYRAYKDKLIHLKEEDSKDDRPEISGEDLDHAYQAIREFAPQMDYDAVEMVIEELKEYKIPEGDKQKVDKLEKLLKAFDWDGIQEMLG